MRNSSTQAKQRWNSANYKQVKVSVKPEIAIAFKEACESANVSMASEISQFMSHYSKKCTNKAGYSPDLSTRRKRRVAVSSIIKQLERIRDNEERYRDNIPDNLQGSAAFDNAEQFIALLCDAIDLLESIY